MNNVLQFPGARESRREASAWVVRMDRGLGPAERDELRTWAAASRNKRALREMATLWADLNVLNSLATLFPLAEARRVRAAPRGLMRRIAMAAAVLAVLGGALWLRHLRP